MHIFQSWERLRLHGVLLTLILNLPLWGRIYIIWFIHKKPAPVYGLLDGWGGGGASPHSPGKVTQPSVVALHHGLEQDAAEVEAEDRPEHHVGSSTLGSWQ